MKLGLALSGGGIRGIAHAGVLKALEENGIKPSVIGGTSAGGLIASLYALGYSPYYIYILFKRYAKDIVEKIGVEKSLSMIDDADLVIVVLNNNEQITKEDKEIIDKTKKKQRIIVINKNDLDKKIDISSMKLENVVTTHANQIEGIKNLKEKIIELFQLETIKSKDYTYLTNARQISLAKQAYQSLKDADKALKDNLPVDMIEIDLKDTFDLLGEIIGETYSEEILDHLFANFCVGK